MVEEMMTEKNDFLLLFIFPDQKKEKYGDNK
jgi:hypothetical protein